MSSTPQKGAFVKFGKLSNLISLQEGNLYFNTVSFFKKLDAASFGRFDKHENINVFMPKAQLKVHEPNNIQKVLYSDTVYDVGINTETNNAFSHIWCCYAIILDTLVAGKEIFSSKMYDAFSNDMLIIYDLNTFYERIRQACENKIHIEGNSVEYRDSLQYQGDMNIFTKFDTHQEQNEYRFAIKQEPLNEPYTLHIGSIADISVLANKSTFANKVELQDKTLILK